MKKIITLLFCLMFVLGMIVSCNNGEPLSAAEQEKLKGKEAAYYGEDYAAVADDFWECRYCGMGFDVYKKYYEHDCDEYYFEPEPPEYND